MHNKGTLIAFRPMHITNHILSNVDLRVSSRALNSRVRNIIEKLVDLGLVKVWKKTARGKTYVIDVLDSRNRILYDIVRTFDINEIASFIEELYRAKTENEINKLIQEKLGNNYETGTHLARGTFTNVRQPISKTHTERY